MQASQTTAQGLWLAGVCGVVVGLAIWFGGPFAVTGIQHTALCGFLCIALTCGMHCACCHKPDHRCLIKLTGAQSSQAMTVLGVQVRELWQRQSSNGSLMHGKAAFKAHKYNAYQ